MLGYLRRKKNSPIILIVLGVVALLMVVFGISFQSGTAGLYAAEVNGEQISDKEYSIYYSNVYRSQQARDQSYNREKAEEDDLRGLVIKQMVNTKLMAQAAEKSGLAMDDAALQDAILADENFHQDGKFSPKLYERIVLGWQTTKSKFQESRREEYLAKVYGGLLGTVRVGDGEIKDIFDRQSVKVDVDFIQVPKTAYKADVGTVTAADVEEWKKRPDAEKKILAYYKRHKATKYDVPKKVCGAHILTRTEKGIAPEQLAAAKKKIREAADKVAAGMDFGEAAKKYSDDQNKTRGGDLGCFSAGQMVPAFEKAAFDMKAGEVSKIVKSPFGFHLIKVNEIKAPVRRKLEEARDEITNALASEGRASKKAEEKAKAIHAAVQTKPFEEVVTALSEPNLILKADSTGPFSQGQEFLPKLGLAKEVTRAAWGLTKESPLGKAPIETDRGWVIIKLKTRTEPTKEEFETAKQTLGFSLAMRKRQALSEVWAQHLRDTNQVTINGISTGYDDDARARARGR